MKGGGRDVAIVGVGYSPVSRGGDPAVERLTTTACRNAIDDAGLKSADIDGSFDYDFGCDSPDTHYLQQVRCSAQRAASACTAPRAPAVLGGGRHAGTSRRDPVGMGAWRGRLFAKRTLRYPELDTRSLIDPA